MEASTKRKRHTDHRVMISDLFSYIIQKKMIKRNFLQKNSEENNALEEIKFEEAKIEYINKNNELEEDKSFVTIVTGSSTRIFFEKCENMPNGTQFAWDILCKLNEKILNLGGISLENNEYNIKANNNDIDGKIVTCSGTEYVIITKIVICNGCNFVISTYIVDVENKLIAEYLMKNVNVTVSLDNINNNNSSVNTVVTDMNNIELSTDSDSSNEAYNINNNHNGNSVVNDSNSIDCENRNNIISESENINININDSKNNGIVINNVVNRSTDENRLNISNYLNNECINVYMKWYRLYNFLADIIYLDYNKEWDVITKSFLVIILKLHSWCDLF
ncbi:hypothetical protein H8356DRAFT_1365503 [Neocallimastix lanati (nom. inval.)]|nr:hypothetical protein H8356DRAFT_1365503 [Neocallimastix sp. JGI-2020a]